jgi:thioesterase domain-containing protein
LSQEQFYYVTLPDPDRKTFAFEFDRSDKAGKLLAMILLKGGQGNRPVTLMGYSLGARVIFSCLEELSRKGDPGAIVERVVLLGAPITLDKGRWEMARKVPMSTR